MKKHILVALTLGLANQTHAAGVGARVADDMDPALLRALAMSQAAAEEEATFQAILAASAAGAGVARGAPLGVAARAPAAVAMDRGTGDDEAALQAALRASIAHPDHVLNTFNERLHYPAARTDFARLTHGLDADNVYQLVALIQSCYPDAKAEELHGLIRPLSAFNMEGIDVNLLTELYILLVTTRDQAEWENLIKDFAARNRLDLMKFFHIDEEGTAAAAAAIDREKAATAAAIDHEIESMNPILRRVLHTLLLDTLDQAQWGTVIKGFVDTNDLPVSRFFAEVNDTATAAVVTALKRKVAEEAAAEAARIEALRETLARQHAATVAAEAAAAAPIATTAANGGAGVPVAASAPTLDSAPAEAARIAAIARKRLADAEAARAASEASATAVAAGPAAAAPIATTTANGGAGVPAAAPAPTLDPARAEAARIAEITRKRFAEAEAARQAARAASEARAAEQAAEEARRAEAEKAARIAAALKRMG